MTVMIEPPSWPDRWLASIGKQRAVYMPDNMPHSAYCVARRESLLRAFLRPKSKQPPPGWLYWNEDTTTVTSGDDTLPTRIVQFLENAKDAILNNLDKDERGLLTAIDFAEGLNLRPDEKTSTALFGGQSLVLDFVPIHGGEIIECKYVRTLKDGTHTECQIKNAMAQVLEQAVCNGIERAILVVFDAGRGRDRPWNDTEIEYVRVFKNNPFGIALTVVRLRIEKEKATVTWEVI